MQILPDVYLIGSGDFGVNLSHPKDCNVYLIDGGDGLTLIDAGVGIEPEKIAENISADGFSVSDVRQLLLTHGHADHSGGARFFKENSKAKVMIHINEAAMLVEADEDKLGLAIARKAGFYPADYRLSPCPVDRVLEDGDEVVVGKYKLKVIWTPGHSKGSVSFFGTVSGRRVLFCGDAVSFDGLIILQNIPGVDIHEYSWGIKRLSGLDIEAFLPGHMLFAVSRGQRHIDAAAEAFDRLGVPRSLI